MDGDGETDGAGSPGRHVGEKERVAWMWIDREGKIPNIEMLKMF